MLKAAVHLLAGRSNAAETTKKIMDDFERLMDHGGDPAQSVELLKPEARLCYFFFFLPRIRGRYFLRALSFQVFPALFCPSWLVRSCIVMQYLRCLTSLQAPRLGD